MPDSPNSTPIWSPSSPQDEMNVGDAQTLDDVLDAFRKFSGSNHERGDLFERLVKRILETDPIYSQQFDKVWRWIDWPGRDGEIDTGVDLVARYTGSGEICAIQCKFHAPNSQVALRHVTNFVVKADQIGATGRIFVSTTSKIARNARKVLDNPDHPVNLLGLEELRSRDISWPDIWHPESLEIKTARYEPRPDQVAARDDVIKGFEKHDRGKMILPCGTGKTFTALQIAESMAGVGGKVLYLVPSIALLGQTMREWAEQKNIPHRYLGICSDVKAGHDDEDLSISALEIPVTTDPEKLAPQLHRNVQHSMTVVFSTYQSIEQVIAAQKSVPLANNGDIREGIDSSEFDLVICDEAHRTTGVETKKGNGSHFLKVHDAVELRAKKRLYMTATPRIYSEAAKNRALKVGQVALYSMDDESEYGPEFHRMTFHDAVEQQLLTDYKVVVLTIEQAYISQVLQEAIE